MGGGANFQMLHGEGREAEERCSDDVTAPDSVISGRVKGQPEVLLVRLQVFFLKKAEMHHFWGFIGRFSATRNLSGQCHDRTMDSCGLRRRCTSVAAVRVRIDRVVFGRAKDG